MRFSVLIRRGSQTTNERGSKKAASYRLRSQLNWSLTNINLSLRLVDSKSGQMIYFGECRNYGWGTMIAASGSMSDCFDQAFSELR